MNIHKENVIEENDWSEFVKDTYKRPYNFQQQDGCKERGIYRFKVPARAEDYKNDTVREECNGPEKGVSFKAWLARDPKQKLKDARDGETAQWTIDLWWDRNFYPAHQMVANDLHAKGLLEAGEYLINIDW